MAANIGGSERLQRGALLTCKLALALQDGSTTVSMCMQFSLGFLLLLSHGRRAYNENNVYKDKEENKKKNNGTDNKNSRAGANTLRGVLYGLFNLWYNYLAVHGQPPRSEDTKRIRGTGIVRPNRLRFSKETTKNTYRRDLHDIQNLVSRGYDIPMLRGTEITRGSGSREDTDIAYQRYEPHRCKTSKKGLNYEEG
eukprot:3383527-Amphidinium_carterae.1